ncbi:MAG: M6 family metalloprotease domain-containing protein [Bacteroidales bacterium]|nr:M6 family metalloprotease domain-containing protein [Bacteroidales bacterium]
MKTFSTQNWKLVTFTFLLSLILFIFTPSLQAAWFDRLPYSVTQPDGSTIDCYASGDEYFNWLHDEDGYTIIVGEDGFYYYGKVQGEFVVPTAYRVNSVDPAGIGLESWAKISNKEYLKRKDAFWDGADKSVKAPHTGTLNSLVVYIRFSDQNEFTQPRSFYDNRFNNPDGVSLKNYFYEVSYEQLLIESSQYPICELTTNLSYMDPNPRNYYEPYHAVNNPNGYQGDNQRRTREHTLLVNAINFIAPEVPTDLVIDADNDGDIDNMCFIIRGNSGAWAELLWAHRWVLYSYNVYINGKRAYDYTFQPENQNNTQTLCHEMFHVLGAPDLYHYTGNGISPAGPWDLMESGFGHMLAYMKYKYADQQWITELPVITVAGTYTLNPLTSSTNNIYKIASPKSSVEFFIVEYRKRTGLYETNLPGDGLLVYRIDPSAGNGNASGPPDEVYIYRPNGTPTSNGNVSQANFSLNVNRTAINDETNPSSFLQNGGPGGLNIFNITASGETISFDILMGTEIDADFTADATTVPVTGSVHFTDLSTNIPNSWIWTFPGGTPASSNLQNPTIVYNSAGIYPVSLVASNNYGFGSITKNDLIIVGHPVIEPNPAVFNLSMEVNTASNNTLNITNPGDTWLRYFMDQEYDASKQSTLKSGNAGEVQGTYGNLPSSRTGLTFANGLLYIVSMGGTLNVYDTLQSAVVNTYDIHNQAFSIAFDGENLWIGSSTGVFSAYDLNGIATGETFSMPTNEIYTLAWDGNSFIANLAGQNSPFFYRLNHQGEILEQYATDLESRASQLVWVPEHTGANLWACSIGKIVRLKEENGQFIVIDEFDSPSNLSYAFAHDGTDFWWSATGGMLFRIDDGMLEWLFINWDPELLQAGQTHEIPLVFNTRRMTQGTHNATIIIESNDFDNPVVEIPVALTVTIPTGLENIPVSNFSVYAYNGEIRINPQDNSRIVIEVFDITGRLAASATSQDTSKVSIQNLPRNSIYLVRVTSSEKVETRKVFIN